MSLELLGANWTAIVNKVVKPLWNNEFKVMYEAVKLDYDDFESLAGYELTRAFKTFTAERSNLFTYATNVIRNKARTELRNYGSRDCRKTLGYASSLNIPIDEDDDVELIDTIPDNSKEKDKSLSKNRVGGFIGKLSNCQLRILILQLLEFETDEIVEILDISKSKYNDAIKGIKSYEKSRILHQRGGF